MALGVAGLTGVVGLKDFALATKGSGLRHAQILCQVLMEIIVLEITQKMNLDPLMEVGVNGLNGARVQNHVEAQLLTERDYATTQHQPMEVLFVGESPQKQS